VNPPEMFEVMNGYWAMLDFCLLIVLVRYLAGGSFDFGNPATKLAVAMVVYFSGDMARHSWAWALWTIRNAGERVTHANSTWWVPFTFAVVASFGLLFIIHTVCPRKYKNWGWLGSLLFAVAVVYLNYRYNFLWRWICCF